MGTTSDGNQQQRAIEEWADATTDTANGTNRRWDAIDGCEIFFMLGSLGTLIILLTLHLYGTIATSADTVLSCVAVFFHAVFAAYFLVHGIRAERPYEMYCFMASYVLICINLACNAVAFPTRTEKVVTAGVAVIFAIPNIFIGGIYYTVKYKRENKLIVRTIVDRLDLASKVVWVYRCKALIVMNLEMALVVGVFACLHGNIHHTQNLHYVVLMVAVSLTINVGYAALGFFLMMREYRCVIFWIVVFAMGQLAFTALTLFYACRLIQMGYVLIGDHDPYPVIGLVCSCIAIIVSMVLMVAFAIVYSNLGYGVHTLVFRRPAVKRSKEREVMFDPTKVEWYGVGPSTTPTN